MRIPAERLRELRNDIGIVLVIHALRLPTRMRGSWLRFLCPACGEFDTATNPKTNLGRCFRCKRNFNPIDLVMVERGVSFLDAVSYLEERVKSSE